MGHNGIVNHGWGHESGAALNPQDVAGLELYARGEISSREFVRRVLTRMGASIPESLQGERRRISAKPVNLKSFAGSAVSETTTSKSTQQIPSTNPGFGLRSIATPAPPYQPTSSGLESAPTVSNSFKDTFDDELSVSAESVSEKVGESEKNVLGSSSMSEDTAAILRGELDIDGWLKRAEEKFKNL